MTKENVLIFPVISLAGTLKVHLRERKLQNHTEMIGIIFLLMSFMNFQPYSLNPLM